MRTACFRYDCPMPRKHNIPTFQTYDTEALENVLESICAGHLLIWHRLELRRIAISLKYDAELKNQGTENQSYTEPLNALTKFKANLQRRKKTSDALTSSRLMNIPEPARAILLSDIAFTFRDELEDYTQINFGNARHAELLKVAVHSSISKIIDKQGRPVNEPLDKFFIGLRDLYEKVTGKEAIARAHYNNKPKTDFEKLVLLGYQIIRPAQEYEAAYKAYERAVSRNSQTAE